MKQQNKHRIIIVVVLLLLAVPLIQTYSIDLDSKLTDDTTITVPKPPSFFVTVNRSVVPQNSLIYIDSDEDFKQLGFPGNGTKNMPYIIENLTISRENAATGISIRDTTVFFIIRNCYFAGLTVGISLYNVTSNTALIINNTFNKNTHGIELYTGNMVVNNTFKDIIDSAIMLSYAQNSTIIGNKIINSESNTDFGVGIYILNSFFSVIKNNSFINSGIEFDINDNSFGYYVNVENKYIIENNTVNQKKLGYFENEQDLIIDGGRFGELIIANSRNVTVENQDISDTLVGILVHYSSEITITNNTLSNTFFGIRATKVEHLTVSNNNVLFSRFDGLSLFYLSGNLTISNNMLLNSGRDGLFIGSYYQEFGLNLVGKIENNIANNSIETGFTINGANGLKISNNIIANNTIGVSMSSSDCLITLNWLISNSNYGIIMYGNEEESINSNNIIHHNNFIRNNLITKRPQAYDAGGNNLWYSKELKEGNYWSDWSGEGPYLIDGPAHSLDLYPLHNTVKTIPELPKNTNWWLWFLLVGALIITVAYLLDHRKKSVSFLSVKKEHISTIKKEPKSKVLSEEELYRIIRKNLKKIIYRGLAIGIGLSLIFATIVPIYLSLQRNLSNNDSNNQQNQQETSINLAVAVVEAIPQAEYIKIEGNGTNVIYKDFLSASIYRTTPSPNLTWTVSADFLVYDEYNRTFVKTINFVLDNANISSISNALFTSINNTEILGTCGEPPYDFLINIDIKWAMSLFLENHTLIDICILENGLVLVDVGTWKTYYFFDTNLLGATILEPESAFDPLVIILHDILEAHVSSW